MDTLPSDSLVEILRVLPFQELIRLTRVNKTFEKAVKESETTRSERLGTE